MILQHYQEKYENGRILDTILFTRHILVIGF